MLISATIRSTVSLRCSLANVNATIAGGDWNPDWGASWSVTTVDEATWQTLRTDVTRAFTELRSALEQEPELSDPMILRGVLALTHPTGDSTSSASGTLIRCPIPGGQEVPGLHARAAT
jgi:hypothetical protein